VIFCEDLLSTFLSRLRLRPFLLLELSVKIKSRIRFAVNVVGILGEQSFDVEGYHSFRANILIGIS